ncbi:hypothetical protein DFJ67_2660 [Asanoa ferruginea]|uniref:GLTT repeat-containing protein n=1 Tax=Asanoa ferruginea TaxID=53367 RepID=A0A3D9ZIJ9_9ACTN|nr:hypothetical protein [Asanoa ferruginea]REF96669.1 hypothetical protein DFJ67_2660 [Asanoa ferruginea]GIF48948.1 hypothetical protein Afe04nite_34870 [Asanoa ferruginea]
MTKWIYRAVGTVGVAAGGALLLAGGAAQADGIDAPVNDLRGSLDGYFTPIGDLPGGGGDLFSNGGGASTKDLAPTQQLGFLAALPSSPTAGVDPTALEAGTGAGQLSADDLSLLSVGDKKIGMDDLGNALGSIGPLADSPAAGTAKSAPALPALGDGPLDLGLDKVAGGPAPTAGSLGEDDLTGAVSSTLSEDNLNTIGSDSQMRTLGSTVDADQLADFGSLGRQAGLGDLGRSGGGLGELTDDPLGAVGKHAAPDPSDFAIAGLKADSLDQIQSLVPPLIGEALEAEMPPGFLGDHTEADPNSNALGLPLIGQLPVDALSTSGNLPVLGSLTAPGGGSAPAGGTAAQPASQTPAAQTPAAKQPAQVPAQSRQPSVSPTPDGGASDAQRPAHRQWSRSSSERPVAGADSEFH